MTKFKIKANDANQTVFKFIKKSFSNTPLSVIYKWFRKGTIKINGRRIKDQKIILKLDDQIEVFDNNHPQVRDQFKYVKDPKLNIIYEDENILIVNKEANIEVHSPINIALDDLVKSYLFNSHQYDPEQENSFVVSHVHRLDKLTSGLIIYAKNKMALDILLTCFQDKTAIEKYYYAKVETTDYLWKQDFLSEGWIKYDSNQQLAVFSEKKEKGFKPVTTFFKLIKHDSETATLEIQLLTGRKHQIRATLAYYKLPILNDFRYGGIKVNQQKMIYLIAYKLVFKKIPAPLNYLNEREFELKLNNW